MVGKMREFIKFMLMLSLCAVVVLAETKLDTRTDLSWKMCSVFKYSKFCLPYILGNYPYVYTYPVPGQVIQVAPFPLIVAPTTSAPSYTIPTIYTTTARPATQAPIPIPLPNPIPLGPCPAAFTVCPAAALTGPIDPRQAFRQFNGCPCMDPRANLSPSGIPTNVASSPSASPSGQIPPGLIGGSLPGGIPSGALPGAQLPNSMNFAPLPGVASGQIPPGLSGPIGGPLPGGIPAGAIPGAQLPNSMNFAPLPGVASGPIPPGLSGPGGIPSGAIPGAQPPNAMNFAPLPGGASGPIPQGLGGPIPIGGPGLVPSPFRLAPLRSSFTYTRINRAVPSTNNCENRDHQCTRLASCTYFESLFQKGVDALTIGYELRTLFCGFDGFDLMICCPLSNMNHSTPSTSQPIIEIYPTQSINDGGFANNNGIVFSSINSHGPISQPVSVAQNHHPSSADSSPLSSNVHNVLDFGSNYSPFNPTSSQIHHVTQSSQNSQTHEWQKPQMPEKPQSSFSSNGFTFAPLIVLHPMPQPINTTASQTNHVTQMPPEINQKPSSSTVSTIENETSNHLPMPKPPNQCGISNYTHSRVVGGTITQIGQYPWIAALGYRFPNATMSGLQFYCAGSLITRSHIITSAHCVSPYLQIARLGEYDLAKRNDGAHPIDFVIERTVVHEEYVPDIILNDIAIVKLRYQTPVNDKIRPICLPLFEPLRSTDLTGYSPYVAGWGSTSFQGPQSSILQDTQVPVIATSECEKNYKTIFSSQIFDDRIICAGSGGHDACQGDSGGPLMLSQMAEGDNGFYYVLIGVVSYGYECAKDGYPGVYTRVSTFLPWIQRNLA